MNSNFNKFDFDLGIGSNNQSSKSLNDQKNKPNPNSSYTYSSSTTTSSFSQPRTTPAWTHQPAPSQLGASRTELGGPSSMVGDITGKSWNSTAPPPKVAVASSVGIMNKNPNLFGDLLNSALGQNKSGSNVPLNSSTPVKNSFSMGKVSESLPKMGGNASGYGNVGNNNAPSWGSGNTSNVGGMKSGTGLGGQPLRSGGGMSSNKDPFGSFVNFSSKPMKRSGGGGDDFAFGDFQNAAKSNPLESNVSSVPKVNTFGTQNQSVPMQSSGGDSFDVFFTSKAPTNGGNGVSDSGVGGETLSGGDDWGVFEGGHDDVGTTELDGLPPPPSGVSAFNAKNKGMDNYKQGQYADAIKWLSWAEILLDKDGDSVGSMEVLSCRASCYKEVGEYKKAVADCTKVLNSDEKNVAVLVQRALLYESMEKYRLGADDLRTVMKLDPGNRVARSTIHRLNKMAD